MRYRPDFFKDSSLIANFQWVLDNCTVTVRTQEQRDFLDSETGTALLDLLFDAKDEQTYLKIASIIEQRMEALVPKAGFAI